MRVEEWLGADNQIGIDIWHKKYQNGNESFDEWLDRVSGGDKAIRSLIKEKKFLFGGRILANRGLNKNGEKVTYSNCYVIAPPEDSIESIFECASKLARTFSYGGGCGIDLGKLAPRGAKIHNTAKETSGAVSFMDLYSMVTGLIGQCGRRGALMISMPCDPPDLEEFIEVKSDLSRVTKANISIRITDDFMEAVELNQPYTLSYTRPETGETITKVVNARDLFRKIAEMNWRTAEPGVLFWDRIKTWNLLANTPEFEFAGVNPCAEEPLPEGGSCLLGSLNLAAFIDNPFTDSARFNYIEFEKAVETAVVALNDVLDEGLPLHPLKEQVDSVCRWRQIGLGIMGLADALIMLGIEYGSKRAVEICDHIGAHLAATAINTSMSYGNTTVLQPEQFCNTDFWKANAATLKQTAGLHNSQLLTIAPTGTLSTMLGVSGGIEPIFANSYTRRTESLHNQEVTYKVYTPIVQRYMEMYKLKDEAELPSYFVTANDIDYIDRIAMQSIWQTHIDASISSTINLPHEATIDDVMKIYMEAWKAGLKGLTIYRAGCEREGILVADDHAEPTNDATLQRGMIEDVPEGLNYRKYKLKTGCGKLYLFVGIDEDEGKIYDFFTNTDGVGGCVVSTQANSRLMSAALRGGVPIEYIIEQLQKAGSCPSYQYARGKGIEVSKGRSCPSAIAYMLQQILDELKQSANEEDATQEPPIVTTSEGGACPSCGAKEVVHEGGCIVCKQCGWSKCS